MLSLKDHPLICWCPERICIGYIFLKQGTLV